MQYQIEAIGVIHSPYRDKFAVPRQPGLVPSAEGYIELHPPYNQSEAVRCLEEFSHIWVLFLFHQHLDKGWTPTVRPPRLGGNKRVGVFASRSPFRPNGIGMSVLKLQEVRNHSGASQIHVEGMDLIDGTPIIDIKPYLPYVDHQSEACGGFAGQAPPQTLRIIFSAQAEAFCLIERGRYPKLKSLIIELLAQDPRPAYHRRDTHEREYGMWIYDYDIHWCVKGDLTEVLSITSKQDTGCNY